MKPLIRMILAVLFFAFSADPLIAAGTCPSAHKDKQETESLALLTFYDAYSRGQPFSSDIVDSLLRVALTDGSLQFPVVRGVTYTMGPRDLAIDALGKTYFQDPRILRVLRRLEARPETQYLAQLALLRRREKPVNYLGLISQLQSKNPALIRELVDIHFKNDLIRYPGFPKLHKALKDGLTGEMTDKSLGQMIAEAAQQRRDSREEISAVLKFIDDLGLTGPHVLNEVDRVERAGRLEPEASRVADRILATELDNPQGRLRASLIALEASSLKSDFDTVDMIKSLRFLLASGMNIPPNYMLRFYVIFKGTNAEGQVVDPSKVFSSNPPFLSEIKTEDAYIHVPYSRLGEFLGLAAKGATGIQRLGSGVDIQREHRSLYRQAPIGQNSRRVAIESKSLDRDIRSQINGHAISVVNPLYGSGRSDSRTYINRKGDRLTIASAVSTFHSFGPQFDKLVESGVSGVLSLAVRLNLQDGNVVDTNNRSVRISGRPLLRIENVQTEVTEFLTYKNGDVPLSMKVRLKIQGHTEPGKGILDIPTTQIIEGEVQFDITDIERTTPKVTRITEP